MNHLMPSSGQNLVYDPIPTKVIIFPSAIALLCGSSMPKRQPVRIIKSTSESLQADGTAGVFFSMNLKYQTEWLREFGKYISRHMSSENMPRGFLYIYDCNQRNSHQIKDIRRAYVCRGDCGVLVTTESVPSLHAPCMIVTESADH